MGSILLFFKLLKKTVTNYYITLRLADEEHITVHKEGMK